MNKITVEQVKGLKKKDRIAVSYLNRDGNIVTKNTRFYGTEYNQYRKKNIILVYVPRKQKEVWEIEEGTECEIKPL